MYCYNDSIELRDPSGNVPVETAFDVISAGLSFLDFVANPSWRTFGYLTMDGISVFMPYVPGSYVLKAADKVDDAVDGAKALGKAVDGADGVVKDGTKIQIPLLETTKSITGKTNDRHIIPAFRGKSKPYADFIAARGIDVDQYTITVDACKGGMHMNGIHGKGGWNQQWMQYIDDNPNATAKDIYQFAGKMLDDYGLSGYTIHPYGGK